MGYTDIYLITIPEGIKNVDPLAAKDPVIVPPDTDDYYGSRCQILRMDTRKGLKPLKYVVTVVDAADKTPLDAKIRTSGIKGQCNRSIRRARRRCL